MTRLRPALILYAVVFASAMILPAHAQTTNVYHTNRVFKALLFNSVGQATAYQVVTMATQLTNVVVGVTNVIVNTNNTRATEYETVAWGYPSATDAWAAVDADYTIYSTSYIGKTYDNVGWVKGTRQAYTNWGAYLWLMQNQIDFMTSQTNFWVSRDSVTGLITKVLVSSLGDYAPMTNVVDIGPTNWASITNFPGSGLSSDAVYKANLDTYYQVLAIRKILLGGSTKMTKYVIGKVYVPTKWGGSNYLYGADIQLFYNGGSNLTWDVAQKIFDGDMDSYRVAQGNPCIYDVPQNDFGWYYVKMTNVSPIAISNSFIETGRAATRPWNGWYWPSLDSAGGPTLYETNGTYTPLLDYDAVYSTSARAAEQSAFFGGTSWEGHCWGWSLASAGMSQPQATTKYGVNFSQDEMEGLYTELANRLPTGPGWTWQVGVAVSAPLPVSPCTVASGESIDQWADDMHIALQDNLREQHRIVIGNLREISGKRSDEVWNHDIFAYESVMKEAPGGNEKLIAVTTTTHANTDLPDMPVDGTERKDTYVYVLEYLADGTIKTSSAKQNWISSSGFPPACLGIVDGNALIWQGQHCLITKTAVDGLY